MPYELIERDDEGVIELWYGSRIVSQINIHDDGTTFNAAEKLLPNEVAWEVEILECQFGVLVVTEYDVVKVENDVTIILKEAFAQAGMRLKTSNL